MPLLSLINSKHRFIEYVLAFNRINVDYLTSADLYPISASGEFFVEVRIDTTRMSTGVEAIVGNGTNTGFPTSNQWLLQKQSSGGLLFQYSGLSGFAYANFIADYPNQVVDVRAVWNDVGHYIFVNGIEKAAHTANQVRPSSPTIPLYVGARGTGVQPSNIDLYGININDQYIWEIQEGIGFPITSVLGGRVFTGQTSNAGQITYWNANVWKKI